MTIDALADCCSATLGKAHQRRRILIEMKPRKISPSDNCLPFPNPCQKGRRETVFVLSGVGRPQTSRGNHLNNSFRHKVEEPDVGALFDLNSMVLTVVGCNAILRVIGKPTIQSCERSQVREQGHSVASQGDDQPAPRKYAEVLSTTRNAQEEGHFERGAQSLNEGSFGKSPGLNGAGADGTGWKYGDSV
jgi:hypothetical protein